MDFTTARTALQILQKHHSKCVCVSDHTMNTESYLDKFCSYITFKTTHLLRLHFMS